jgi:hypothetical protein
MRKNTMEYAVRDSGKQHSILARIIDGLVMLLVLTAMSIPILALLSFVLVILAMCNVELAIRRVVVSGVETMKKLLRSWSL